MEYIHKAKAEKTRTKVLSDQMEARRVKNKVRTYYMHRQHIFICFLTGCPRASRSTCGGEATGDHRGRDRCCRSGVNISSPFVYASVRQVGSDMSCCIVVGLCIFTRYLHPLSPYVYPMSCISTTIIRQAPMLACLFLFRIYTNGYE